MNLTWATKTATERADAIRAAEHLSLDCRDRVHGACDGCDCDCHQGDA